MPRGEPGELCTRGYSVMLGYWNDAPSTAAAIDEARWMHTGDLAVMRDDGYARIFGRLKDMIIRGGENIYPREIEEFLYTHPAIADVQVIGVPDAKYGEEVCAWVRLHDGRQATVEEIREYCRGQIATYKIPRYVRFTTEFPMTVTGKVQLTGCGRSRLRSWDSSPRSPFRQKIDVAASSVSAGRSRHPEKIRASGIRSSAVRLKKGSFERVTRPALNRATSSSASDNGAPSQHLIPWATNDQPARYRFRSLCQRSDEGLVPLIKCMNRKKAKR